MFMAFYCTLDIHAQNATRRQQTNGIKLRAPVRLGEKTVSFCFPLCVVAIKVC